MLQTAHVVIHRGAATVHIQMDARKEPSLSAFLSGKKIWSDIPKDWHPWKLLSLDVDNDNKEEFVVALHKLTRHLPHRLHTLFVFGFDGERIYPKWRGSSMGRDFEDFIVVHTTSGSKVVTLDRLLDGKYAVALHYWKGFGFLKEWEYGAWKSAKLLADRNGFTVNGNGKQLRFTVQGDSVIGPL